MHLLTREAFQVYAQHLRAPASVIAVHISNQTLDLRPVLAGISRDFSLHAVRVDPLLPTGPFSQSDWILLSRDSASLSGEGRARRTLRKRFLPRRGLSPGPMIIAISGTSYAGEIRPRCRKQTLAAHRRSALTG